VAVPAVTETLFHNVPLELVMLEREVTFTVDLTRYAVPASEDCTVALAEPVSVAAVKVADGAAVSIVTDSEFDVADESVTVMLHVPSSRVPNVQLSDESVQITFDDPAFVAVIVPPPEIVAGTEKVGVLSVVKSSEFDIPKSEAVVKSGVPILISIAETVEVFSA
jgi:hypothetical protein